MSVSILLLLFHIFLRHHHGTAATWLESLKNGQDDACLLSVASSLVGGCLFSPLSIHLIPYFQGALVLSSLRGRGSSNEAMTKEETASERTRSLARPTSNQPKDVFQSCSTIRGSL